MFAGMVRAYLSEDAQLSDRLLALPKNKLLCWKSLPVINTLAYYKNSQTTDYKSDLTLSPGACIKKLITTIIYGFP
jgi:hypothetical protein